MVSALSRHPETSPKHSMAPIAPESIAAVCRDLIPDPAHRSLLEGLHRMDATHSFTMALTGAPWYRVGGVVTAKGERVADDLAEWAYAESSGEVMELVAKCAEERLFATRIEGKTHYLAARTGPHAWDFIQLEVEEMQEVLDRPLFSDDWVPEDLEDFIDPLHHPPREGRPLQAPRYRFSKLTCIRAFFEEMARYRDVSLPAERFMADWNQSSAGRHHTFCFHWVLELHENAGLHGERLLDATPLSLVSKPLPQPGIKPGMRGLRLANAIQSFDRKLGYPFAWYFHMLRRDRVPSHLATSVLADLRDDYAYLPTDDVQVLERWSQDPYYL